MREFTLGDAPRFKATFRDSAGTLFDPTSTSGKVFDAAGSLVVSFGSLTKLSTGIYAADWQTTDGVTAKGTYSFEASGVWGAFTYKRLGKNIVRLI